MYQRFDKHFHKYGEHIMELPYFYIQKVSEGCRWFGVGCCRVGFASDSDSSSDLDSVDVLACVGLPDLGATWGFALRGFTV